MLKDVFPFSELFFTNEGTFIMLRCKIPQNNLPLLILDMMLTVRITEIFHPGRAVTEHKRLYEFHHYCCNSVSAFTEWLCLNNEGPDISCTWITYFICEPSYQGIYCLSEMVFPQSYGLDYSNTTKHILHFLEIIPKKKKKKKKKNFFFFKIFFSPPPPPESRAIY